MILQNIYIRPYLLLTCIFSSLLLSYYSDKGIILLPIVLILLWLNKKKTMVFALIFGALLGISLNLFIDYGRNTAYCGLELHKVEKFTIRLSEDSFLSSKGRRIYRGQLISVSSEYIQCGAVGSVLVIGTDDSPLLYWGEVVEFSGSITDSKEKSEFSYVCFIQSQFVRFIGVNYFYSKRRGIKEGLETHMNCFSKDVFSLFNALYTGNSDELNGETKDLFKKCGLNHLLALSGFHVAIIVIILTYFLKIVMGKSAAIILSFPSLLFYLFLIGPSPSLLRAVIMYFTGGVLILFHKEVSILYILILSFILQLFCAPLQGLSLSFQLSYLALFGILIIGKQVNYLLKPWIPSFLRYPFSASLGAHIFTAPVLIYYFNEIYPVGVIASIAVTPLITLFMWVSLFTFILSPQLYSSFLAESLNRICEIILEITIQLTQFFSKVPGITFSTHSDIFVYLSLLVIIVLSLYIDCWRIYGRGTSPEVKLRFTVGNTVIAGNHGIRSQKKMEPEFPDQ